MSFVRESVTINGKPLTFETGRLAKQAHGSILITYGESVVLVTAVSGDERPGLDFFPLTCEYVEKTFAAGKIPGGFFKREARLRDEEILTCRLIDRPLPPALPRGLQERHADHRDGALEPTRSNPTDVLALTGASAALHISDIPWAGPIVGVRVARIDGELIVVPDVRAAGRGATSTWSSRARKDAIVMVEGGAAEASEKPTLIDALLFAHKAAQPIIELIEKMRAAVGKPKRAFAPKKLDEPTSRRAIAALVDNADHRELAHQGQEAKRYDGYKTAKNDDGRDAHDGARRREGHRAREAHQGRVRGAQVRTSSASTSSTRSKRIDGRDMKTDPRRSRPRSASCRACTARRCSSAARRRRIVTTTLGTSSDEQKIDALIGERWKRFMLHYNFPPFSTGETKPMRGPGRREIGHGALAERALVAHDPGAGEVPVHDPHRHRDARVERLVVDGRGVRRHALAHGRGVPIKAPVAGIAMGLITDGKRVRDPERHPRRRGPPRRHGLQGLRHRQGHHRDPDGHQDRGPLARDPRRRRSIRRAKAACTSSARCSRRSRRRARSSRQYAPRITTIKVKPDQIRIIIGPGGKTIKGIVDQTGVAIDVEDDGTVNVASSDSRRRAEGARDHQGPHGGARGRRDLQGHRQAHRATSAPSSRSCRAPRRSSTSREIAHTRIEQRRATS